MLTVLLGSVSKRLRTTASVASSFQLIPSISSISQRFASTSSTSRIPPPPTRSKQLSDEAIPHPVVCLVDPSTGALLPASPLRTLLASLDRTRFTLHLVDAAHEPPICRIIDRKEVYAKQQEKKALNAAGLTSGGTVKGMSGPPREVQLSWGVTAHDMGHKLGKAKELLKKGFRVAVVITVKKGADSVDAKGRAAVIENVKEAVKEFGVAVSPPNNKGGQCIIEFKKIDS